MPLARGLGKSGAHDRKPFWQFPPSRQSDTKGRTPSSHPCLPRPGQAGRGAATLPRGSRQCPPFPVGRCLHSRAGCGSSGPLCVELGGVREAGLGLCQPGPPVGGGCMPPPRTPAEPPEPPLCFPFLGTVRRRGIRSSTRTCGGNEAVPPLSWGGVSAKSGAELLPRHRSRHGTPSPALARLTLAAPTCPPGLRAASPQGPTLPAGRRHPCKTSRGPGTLQPA